MIKLSDEKIMRGFDPNKAEMTETNLYTKS